MNDENHEDWSDQLRCGRRIEAPAALWSRIAATATQSPTTSQKLGALVLGCTSFVFAAKLWQVADPHVMPAAIEAQRARDAEASLALALPWFETGRLDASLASLMEDRPELLLLREARSLHSNPLPPEAHR